jgi:cysteinyl-tRNA synthetase
MSMQLLGDQIDIHGGGEDVIFPHHEDEIAQSESYTGKKPFVKYWLHNGLLRPSADQEKMTRHLGNFISCREALERYNPDAIRLFVLSSHYRSPVTWSEEGILASDRGLERLRTALKPAAVVADSGREELLATVETARNEFMGAMDDDFNAARAIGHLFDLGRAINQARDEGVPAAALATSQDVLRELAGVLGLTLEEPTMTLDPAPFRELATSVRDELVAAGKPELAKSISLDALAETPSTEAERLIGLLLSVRSGLRAAREYGQADKIRNGLSDLGVVVEDAAGGSTWRMVTPPESSPTTN